MAVTVSEVGVADVTAVLTAQQFVTCFNTICFNG